LFFTNEVGLDGSLHLVARVVDEWPAVEDGRVVDQDIDVAHPGLDHLGNLRPGDSLRTAVFTTKMLALSTSNSPQEQKTRVRIPPGYM
jgi:hypothetical protein